MNLSKIYNWFVVAYTGKRTSEKIFLFVLQIAALAVVTLTLSMILNILLLFV